MHSALPVAQLKQSHALKLDPNHVPPRGFYTLAIAPYPRMSPGDRITFNWQGWDEDDREDDPWSYTLTVGQAGQVALAELPETHVQFLEGGYAQLGYRVAYADSQGGAEDAPLQRLDIVPPSEPLLPAVTIEGHTGEQLDPEAFPQGLVMTIAGYPGMQAGDAVLLYASSTRSGQDRVLGLRVEQSHIEAGELRLTLEAAWLPAQLNEQVSFVWQYARLGAAGSATPLQHRVQAAWRPSAPVVVDALPEPNDPLPGRGYIEAVLLHSGGKVRIPADVALEPNDQVQVHWQGFGSSGDYIASEPDASNPRQFSIPAAAVPANMGKRLDVVYRVTRPGQPQATSRPFDLRVVEVPRQRFHTLQCACVSAGKLILACVPTAGAQLTLERWIFMAPGQLVSIRAESRENETVLENEPVTEAHLQAGKFLATLSHDYLHRLGAGERLNLRVWVSFDDGHSRIEFPGLNLVTSASFLAPAAISGTGKNRLLERLREGPQTLGWGAILAFSRHDLNRLLERSHIERCRRALHIPPFKGFIGDSDSAGEYFDGCTFSAARLSFEGADVQQAEPGVRLTMSVISGRQLTLERIQGHLQATRLWQFDPRHGLQLSVEVPLSNTAADADSAGQVVIDLREGARFRFGVAGQPQERFVDGEPFERLFKSLSDAQSILPLVQINQASNHVIQPARVSMRTQPSPQADAPAGDGALLLLLAMHGQEDGEAPGAGFGWLLGDDADSACGVTVLLSNRLLLDKVFGAHWLQLTNDRARWNTLHEPSGFARLEMTGGSFRLGSVNYSAPAEMRWVPPFLNFAADPHAALHVVQDQVRLDIDCPVAQTNSALILESNHRHYAAFMMGWQMSQAIAYSVDQQTQTLQAESHGASFTDFSCRLTPEHAHDATALLGAQASADDRDLRSRAFIEQTAGRLLDSVDAINDFLFGAVQLADQQRLVPEEVAVPGDLVVFASNGPPAQLFWLDPPPSVVAAGESVQLRTSLADPASLSWRVASLFGNPELPGSISPTGLYTAPEHFDGTCLEVLVTAERQEHRCSALIRVVAHPITVNPVVQIGLRGQRCRLSAATGSAGPLTWSLRDAGNGGKLIADEHGARVYQAPDDYRLPEYCVDEIVVCDESSGQSQSAWVMTLFNSMVHSIVPDHSADLPAHQLKLDVLHGGTTLVPGNKITWQLLAGEGQVANGIYTQPQVLQHRFALLLATQREAGRVFNGCLLLALPLVAPTQTPTPGLQFTPL